MSISEKLTKIRNTLKAIKQAIINKGQTPSGDITTYPDAIGNISSGAEIKNQSKTTTENGTVTPDEGYTGLSDVTVNVPTTVNNQFKQISTNGYYKPDSGYSGFGAVVVTVSGGSSGSILITENGDYDVTNYAKANVQVTNYTPPTTTLNITQNGTYDVTYYGTAEVNVGGTQYIPREVTTEGVLQVPSTNFTFSLPPNVISIGRYCLYYALQNCTGLTSVDFSNVISIDDWGLNYAFSNCTNLTSVDFSRLTDIGFRGLLNGFEHCTRLTSVDFSRVISIDSGGLQGAFYGCSNLTSLNFPALTSVSFGASTYQFDNMLANVTGCTVHFPSNLESVIGSWSSVARGFGGNSTQILFDLPATS